MNKEIKKVIAVALTVSAFCAISPATKLNLMTTKAYASSSDADELDELKLETSGGSSIKLYSDDDYDSDNKVDNDDVDEGDTYYAKTSSSKIQIDIDGADNDKVRIFKGSSDKDYEVGDDISLSSGTTTLKVRVYEDDYDDYDDYDDANDSDYNEYTIKVKCTSSDSSDDEDDSQDDVYLDNITLDYGDTDIDFDEDKTSYNIKVPESQDEISIKAEPEDDDYDVRIDGSTVDEDDKYRKDVDLDKGENEIKIKVEDDDDNTRTYTLNVTRGTSTSTGSESTTDSGSTTTTAKPNQWVSLNGKWTYNDALGNPLKNTWFTDRNSGKTYYLQADGTMSTGWLYNAGAWYYLTESGEKQSGWALVSGSWYYLDSDGKMQTGWLKDMSGKWYYLQTSGVMAKNTTISGYKLGSDGAMI